MEKNGINVSSASGSTAFVSSLSSRQSPWQSPCSTLYYTLCEKHNLDTTYFLSKLPWLRTLLPGTNTIPQILPPPQQIGASSLNQVHRQHCNINDFSETHRTRRYSCNNQWVQRPTCKLPTHSNRATGVPHLQLLRLTSCCGGIHLEHLDREAVWELSEFISRYKDHFCCC